MKRCSLKIISCGSCRHPAFMTRKGASLRPEKFPSLVGIIEHPDEGIILFDTGYDPAFLAATQAFPERLYRWTTPVTLPLDQIAVAQLEKMGHRTQDVRRIIISHFHGDHVSGLHNFPKAIISCARTGLNRTRTGSRFDLVRTGVLSSLIPDDLPERAQFFEDAPRVSLPGDFRPFLAAADILGDGSLLAVELPGHCPGHWGLAVKAQNDRFIFLVGDAAWSITAVKANIAPPKLTMSILGGTKDYYKTLGDLNEIYCDNRNILILPSHCDISVKRFNGGAA